MISSKNGRQRRWQINATLMYASWTDHCAVRTLQVFSSQQKEYYAQSESSSSEDESETARNDTDSPSKKKKSTRTRMLPEVASLVPSQGGPGPPTIAGDCDLGPGVPAGHLSLCGQAAPVGGAW